MLQVDDIINIIEREGRAPIEIPSQEIDVTPSTDVSMWRGENEKIGEEDQEFDEVQLLPPTMKSIKVI